MKNLVYAGHMGAEGTAMAVHTRSIARLCEDIGYHVSFVCKSLPYQKHGFGDEDHYRYIYAKQYITAPKLRAVEWMLEELTGWKHYTLIKKMHESKPIDVLIFYGYSAEERIIRFCKKNGIKVIVDRTDWFEVSDAQDAFGKWFNRFISEPCVAKYDSTADGVIAISDYFVKHYEAMDQNVIWIPPMFVLGEEKQPIVRTPSSDGAKLRLVYAGSLGQSKDTISPVIDALQMINVRELKVSLDLIGIDEPALNSTFGRKDWASTGIHAHGYLPNDKTLAIVREADFSVLLRQNKRYAKAGFSTKFAESMCVGVPVICTKVGGADLYIDDLTDGVLLPDNATETVEACILRLLKISDEQITQMKSNAYRKASSIFDHRTYREPLRDFINQLYREE